MNAYVTPNLTVWGFLCRGCRDAVIRRTLENPIDGISWKISFFQLSVCDLAQTLSKCPF